jgi:tripartite ATP-independent transporter DctM subunit
MSGETIGFLGLAALFVLIFVGFPISFTLIFLALGMGFIGLSGRVTVELMTLQFFSVMNDIVLAAVPFFLFMGYILEDSGLMVRLFRAFQLLMGGVRGALYLAVAAAATVFAACTGIVGSSVTLLGVMAAPTMKESGYDTRLSAGCITAGGTLGILIPPSIMLVVMGPVLGVPVTDLFAGAILPGVLLAGLFAGYALLRSFLNPKLGPPLPPEKRAASVGVVLKESFIGVVPVAFLIAATLGSIVAGIATPTEGAALGATGAVVLSAAYRRLSFKGLATAMVRTLEVSAMILFLVAASNFFGSVFSRLGSATLLTKSLLALQLEPSVMVIGAMVIIFVLGWPLEWVPIVLIFIPMLLPAMREMGVNMLWFGIAAAVTMQTAWLSPPVALSAYFLKGVVPDWKLKDIYAGMFQFMVLQMLGVALVIAFPQLVLWLPSLLR